MTIQDRVSHAAAVARWKADQQLRILKVQNQIHEVENQIRTQKASLAETALSLNSQGKLVENELNQICQAIATLHEQIVDLQKLQDGIKNEQAPQLQAYTSNYPTPSPQTSYSGLICPKCGRQLVGNYCPEHGVEGILPANQQPEKGLTTETAYSDEAIATAETIQKPIQEKSKDDSQKDVTMTSVESMQQPDQETKKSNIQANETVSSTAISQESEQVAATEIIQQTESAKTKLVCPICKRSLNGRFCPEHGVEGVRIN